MQSNVPQISGAQNSGTLPKHLDAIDRSRDKNIVDDF
jgi:hypothetical protein